jgi:class 3 adenylate cyclase/tetratricopeptide (TPR) repeat protein
MRTCLRCGQENPAEARFCLHCGEPLVEPEQRRVERKVATVLFADLVGSTSLAEREDAEVVQTVVGRAFDRLSEEIARHGGLLEKFMGDAVLAIFGVPRAHEDDPERAVRAAFEMQAVLSELNRAFAAEGMPQLQMRIGVEAGEILVDQDRVSGPRDRMLTGDAVNVAARLQTAAEPGRTIVGPGVYAATKDVIEYRELPAFELKGKTERVPAWQALRIRAQQRGERPQLGMQAALVGRDEELAVLTQTFRRVQSEGRPALVTVIGPAGVGKSRLSRELEAYVEALPEDVYWRRGRCLAYGNVAYSALADAIKAQCEILEDDLPEVTAQKVEKAVFELFGTDEVVPQIAALVGAADAAGAGPGDTASFSRDELFDAWRRFLERMASRFPLVLLFEDIHWADTGLLDFIDHLADWSQGPIVIVALARPELFDARPSWGGGKRNAAAIYLDPLSAAESAAMLSDLLSVDVGTELAGMVAERSEGNPLYVEEIVRKLIDDGVLRAADGDRWEIAQPVTDVAVPRSIHSLIAARLDALPDDEKEMLQSASVVGRVFWAGAVAALTGCAAGEVRDALGRLRVKELVLPNEPSSFSGESELVFRHALIRDGAYDSLPKSTRATKHEEVARWAEQRGGARGDEIAGLLATHLGESLRYLDELGTVPDPRLLRQAYRWARTAGDRAVALWLQADASLWYERALDLSERTDVPTGERAALAFSLLRAGWGTIPNERAVEAGRRAMALSREIGDDRRAGAAHALMILIYQQLGDEEAAEAEGEAALALLEPLGESPELAEALHRIGWLGWRHGQDASATLRRAVEMARRIDAPVVLAGATHTLAVQLSQNGEVEESLAMLDDAFALAKEVDDQLNLLRIYTNMSSILATDASDLPRSLEVALEGLEVSRRAGATGFVGWQLENAGWVQMKLGDVRSAEESFREGLEAATQVGDGPLVGFIHQDMAQLYLAQGRLDEGIAELQRSDDTLRDRTEVQGISRNARLHAMVDVANGDRDAALARLRKGADHAFGSGVNYDPWLFFDLFLLLARNGGGDDEARALLERFAGRTLSPAMGAVVSFANGLFAASPAEAIDHLTAACTALEGLRFQVEHGRALLELARAYRAGGIDPTAAIERSREVLAACGAGLYLPEVDAFAAAR